MSEMTQRLFKRNTQKKEGASRDNSVVEEPHTQVPGVGDNRMTFLPPIPPPELEPNRSTFKPI